MARKNEEQLTFEFEPIKGFPMLNWKGKHPFKSTVYYPAQLKEKFGESKPYTDKNGKSTDWLNKIFWGDNLQVMSHLLKEFRGMIDLIYIDPPFDSKADYKKTIKLRGKEISNDRTAFEENNIVIFGQMMIIYNLCMNDLYYSVNCFPITGVFIYIAIGIKAIIYDC